MPHTKSCIKRLKTAEKSRVKNRQMKSRILTATKHVLQAKDKNIAIDALNSAYSILDKAAKKGILHKNKAANQKKKLYKSVQAIK